MAGECGWRDIASARRIRTIGADGVVTSIVRSGWCLRPIRRTQFVGRSTPASGSDRRGERRRAKYGLPMAARPVDGGPRSRWYEFSSSRARLQAYWQHATTGICLFDRACASRAHPSPRSTFGTCTRGVVANDVVVVLVASTSAYACKVRCRHVGFAEYCYAAAAGPVRAVAMLVIWRGVSIHASVRQGLRLQRRRPRPTACRQVARHCYAASADSASGAVTPVVPHGTSMPWRSRSSASRPGTSLTASS